MCTKRLCWACSEMLVTGRCAKLYKPACTPLWAPRLAEKAVTTRTRAADRGIMSSEAVTWQSGLRPSLPFVLDPLSSQIFPPIEASISLGLTCSERLRDETIDDTHLLLVANNSSGMVDSREMWHRSPANLHRPGRSPRRDKNQSFLHNR